jgi:xylan 1,4-beta-xylosidase
LETKNESLVFENSLYNKLYFLPLINKTAMRTLIILCFILLITNSSAAERFEVDVQKVVGSNHKFWQAAGQDLLWQMSTRPAGDYLLNRISKYQSIRYLRTHATFSNKKNGGEVVRWSADKKTYQYDFTKINTVIELYLKHGIKPIIEFDFFPDNFAKPLGSSVNVEGFKGSDGEPLDWDEWEKLQHAFMVNLTQKFGKDEMAGWYFEVWNEPDGWPLEHLPVFYRLYDTFAFVVKSHDQRFRVGGPGTFTLPALQRFLQHIKREKNYKTGEKGAPCDFISHHIYGLSGGWLAMAPEITPQVSRFSIELLTIQRMLKEYKALDKEFLLDEWGVCSNFEREVKDYPQLKYRNNEFSPLFMTKLIDCVYAIEDNYKFKTSMMLYWGFSGEDEKNKMFIGNRELTTGGNTPKPILTGFELLSYLKENRLKVTGNRPGNRVGIIPTGDKNGVAFALYNFNETDDNFSFADTTTVILRYLEPSKKYKLTTYLLDQKTNNSYFNWINAGSVAVPNQLPIHWQNQFTNHISETAEFESDANGTLKLDFNLYRHSMRLAVLSK